MRFAGPGLLFVAVVLLAGCGGESARQAGARTAVEEALSDSYARDETRCTGNPSPWFIEREAEVFVCAAKRREGGCDWYRATLRNAGWEVALERERADCILPF